MGTSPAISSPDPSPTAAAGAPMEVFTGAPSAISRNPDPSPMAAAAAPAKVTLEAHADIDISQLRAWLNSPLEKTPSRWTVPMGLLAEQLVVDSRPLSAPSLSKEPASLDERMEQKEHVERPAEPKSAKPDIYDVTTNLYNPRDNMKFCRIGFRDKIYLTYQDSEGVIHVICHGKRTPENRISMERRIKELCNAHYTKLKPSKDPGPDLEILHSVKIPSERRR